LSQTRQVAGQAPHAQLALRKKRSRNVELVQLLKVELQICVQLLKAEWLQLLE
jgi:hypothetical protein